MTSSHQQVVWILVPWFCCDILWGPACDLSSHWPDLVDDDSTHISKSFWQVMCDRHPADASVLVFFIAFTPFIILFVNKIKSVKFQCGPLQRLMTSAEQSFLSFELANPSRCFFGWGDSVTWPWCLEGEILAIYESSAYNWRFIYSTSSVGSDWILSGFYPGARLCCEQKISHVHVLLDDSVLKSLKPPDDVKLHNGTLLQEFSLQNHFGRHSSWGQGTSLSLAGPKSLTVLLVSKCTNTNRKQVK